jgi:hypothetical protein
VSFDQNIACGSGHMHIHRLSSWRSSAFATRQRARREFILRPTGSFLHAHHGVKS